MIAKIFLVAIYITNNPKCIICRYIHVHAATELIVTNLNCANTRARPRQVGWSVCEANIYVRQKKKKKYT